MTSIYTDLVQTKQWIIDKYVSSNESYANQTAIKLLLSSDFVGKHIDLLKKIQSTHDWHVLPTRHEYFDLLRPLSFDLSMRQYMQELRQFRNQQFIRLLLLEANNYLSIEQVMTSWSDCADAIILHALDYCYAMLAVKYGEPVDANNAKVVLLCLAMGKLGGRELNYSSDVDLIFAYSAVGFTNGAEVLDNQHFFSKLIQHATQILQNSTEHGFVFRVDLRLRPNGDSGPLVSSLNAMEHYYQDQGRDWERYAMVKARVIHESLNKKNEWFDQVMGPFIYRRYVDYSVIESLRGMKAMIVREVQLNPDLNDIKRGRGGIREVEFIIQNVQLIRGGRLYKLRHQNAMTALNVLDEERLLSNCDVLKNAYLFLRQLENALQSLNDQQTHLLPTNPLKQQQIVLALNEQSWPSLIYKMEVYRNQINAIFIAVLAKVEDYEDENRVLNHQLMSIWQGHVEQRMAINLLSSLGYSQAEYSYQIINVFRHSPRCRRLTQSARMRLDRFMPLLLKELTLIDKKDQVLLDVMHLLENIVGRSAYLALLTENAQVLTELLLLFSKSPFIASLVVQYPFLLEVLLDQHVRWHPPNRNQLHGSLKEKLSHVHDMEAQEEVLRQFKLSNWLLAARAELDKHCDSIRIGQFLADVAQVLVLEVFVIASSYLAARYPEMKKIPAHFAIIAYGKLGSRELNYSSDLDLVFLHTLQPNEEPLVTRLTQKILHMLTTRSRSGILYAVDTRLRPSGAAGLLVSHFATFVEYQKKHAWTWEHQALCKARVLCASPLIATNFLHLKKELFGLVRNRKTVQNAIIDMRLKIAKSHREPVIKYQTGGLVDLEFMVQYLILISEKPQLAYYTHTLSQLNCLFKMEIISSNELTLLKRAYRYFHRMLHWELLTVQINLDDSLFIQINQLYNSLLEINQDDL